MRSFPNGLPQFRWRNYLLVDGWTYQTEPKRIVFLRDDYEALCHIRASWVLKEIIREDQTLCGCLLGTKGRPRYLSDHDTYAALAHLLGAPRDRFLAEVDRFARLIIFERKWPKPAPPPKIEIERIELAPLSATTSWVAIECTDDDEPPRPRANVVFEVITASAEVRTVRSSETGTLLIDRIAPGRVTIRVVSLDGKRWRPADGSSSAPSSHEDRTRWQVVEPGQTLAQIAGRAGLASWQDVWQHAKNGELRKRGHPSRIVPGDNVAVPAPRVFELAGPTEQTYRIAVMRSRPRTAFVLSSPELSFGSDSCVVRNECRDLTDPKALTAASAVDALATALQHAREHEAQRMLVVGHADTSGDPDRNQTLSENRAKAVKHLLLGERDAWVELVRAHSNVADYQQLLAWLSLVRGWPCTPFAVDGREQPDNARILRAFQVAYNREYAASIAEDGAIGPETWGALFDVYQDQLAYRLEIDTKGLAALRDAVKFCGAAETHGFGTFSAAHARGEGAATSARHRRAEVLFFEAGEEPTRDDLEPGPLGAPDFALTPIAVRPGAPLVWISLQTVDDLGFRRGQVALLLASEGTVHERTTDDHGVWQGQTPAGRAIEIRRADGGLVRFGSGGEAVEQVVIQPRWAGALTDLVIVGSADPAVLEAQRAQLRRYAPISQASRRTSRGVVAQDDQIVGEPLATAPAGEAQDRAIPRRAMHSHVADNLLLAAELGRERLPGVVATWLGDYYPEAARRGFFLIVVQGRDLVTFADDGTLLRSDRLAEDVQVHGPMGVYALVESDQVADGAIFVDLASARTILAVSQKAQGSEDNPAPPSESPPPITSLAQVVEEQAREDFATFWHAQLAARKVPLTYYIPEGQLGTLARIGGTGLLEPYPADGSLRDHIHTRNCAVAKTAGVVYRHYIDHIVQQVRALDPSPANAEKAGKPHPEEQLRELTAHVDGGPVFPRAAGADEAEWVDVLQALDDTDSYPVLKAYTEKFNAIFGIRTAGSAWLAAEVSLEGKVGAGDTKGKIKLNFEVNTDEKDGSLKVKVAAAKPIQLKPSQVDVEVDEEGVVKAKGKGGALGPLEIELGSNGVIKVTYEGVSSVYDTRQEQAIVEVQVSLRDLVCKALKHRWGPAGEPAWVKELPDLKIKAQLGMQLSRVSDVEAVVRRTPGHKEGRPRHAIETLQWSSFSGPERQALEILGFDPPSWDNKIMPESTKRPFSSLTDEQRFIVSQNFPTIPRDAEWEKYWADIEWKHRDHTRSP